MRVYPGGVAYTRLGRQRAASETERRIFENHLRVYAFAAQFVAGKRVADVGCGSGCGSELLAKAGAAEVLGSDLSRHAIAYAQRHFGSSASFSRQSAADLDSYADGLVDVVVSSEVLEHLKDYGLERRGLAEAARILRPGGLLVLGTPNAELLPGHGFSYDELSSLFPGPFAAWCLVENALVPHSRAGTAAWEERVRSGRIGRIATASIVPADAVVPPGVRPELKQAGEPAAALEFAGRLVDTTLLHNTHSWLVLAVKAGG